MKKKFISLSIALLATIIVCAPMICLAAIAEKEVKAALTVSAVVPSIACAQFSSATINVSDILADASQKALVTVKVNDCDKEPIAGANVILTSNRGQIDTILAVSSDGVPIDLPIGQKGPVTNSSGYVYFQVSSDVPGDALLSTLVDATISLDQLKLTFLPLPFPKNITVTIEVPKLFSKEGSITLFRPAEQSIDRKKLVNLGVEYRVPYWITLAFIGLTGLNVLLLATIILLSVKIIRQQKIEMIQVDQELSILTREEKDIEDIKNSTK